MYDQRREEKLEIRNSKMPNDMQRDILDAAQKAFNKTEEPRAIATDMKRFCDNRYAPNWQCIVGRHFGSFVTHEEDKFIYFNKGKTAILLFKTA